MHQLINKFTSYELNEEERNTAYVFNSYQLAQLRNELAIVAEELVSLQPESIEDSLFHLKRAALQGQANLLTYLIERSEAITQSSTNSIS